MKIAEFFLVRNHFFNHIRYYTKKVKYDQRIDYVKANKQFLFNDFRYKSFITAEAAELLFKLAINDLSRMQKQIDARVKDALEQIQLTNDSRESANKKREYIKKKQDEITYFTTRFHAKFSRPDQMVIPESLFDGDTFTGFRKRATDDTGVQMVKYDDVRLVRLLPTVEEEKPLNDLISNIETKNGAHVR